MKYTVVSTPSADERLAEIWLRAIDRQEVADASDAIHKMLQHDPERMGRARQGGRRVVVVKPLSATFEISEPDRLVTIVSIQSYWPRRGTP